MAERRRNGNERRDRRGEQVVFVPRGALQDVHHPYRRVDPWAAYEIPLAPPPEEDIGPVERFLRSPFAARAQPWLERGGTGAEIVAELGITPLPVVGQVGKAARLARLARWARTAGPRAWGKAKEFSGAALRFSGEALRQAIRDLRWGIPIGGAAGTYEAWQHAQETGEWPYRSEAYRRMLTYALTGAAGAGVGGVTAQRLGQLFPALGRRRLYRWLAQYTGFPMAGAVAAGTAFQSPEFTVQRPGDVIPPLIEDGENDDENWERFRRGEPPVGIRESTWRNPLIIER